MSFIYPRLLAIHRPNINSAVGAQPYAGLTKANETVIATGLPASIQLDVRSGKPDGNTPSDAYKRAGFRVFIPKAAAVLGSIKENDVVIDDLGQRYQVNAAYWNSLGYNLSVDLLKP